MVRLTDSSAVTGIGASDDALAGSLGRLDRLGDLIDVTLAGLVTGFHERPGPLPAGGPDGVERRVETAITRLLPERGTGAEEALRLFAHITAAESTDPAHPGCVGHLHCPPLAVAAAADVIASVLNPSMDSWDQAPVASILESRLIAELSELAGYRPTEATGVFTTGGTESNLMGLLLAREHCMAERFGVDATADGLPAAAGQARIFTSEQSHFSVQRAAALIGLGERSVVSIPTDEHNQMDVGALRSALARPGIVPLAVVATAGTTDFGAIDPVARIAELTSELGVWLHVDAAYGGALLFSDRLAGLLDGIERADSIAMDLHKFGWQPVAAGVFLARQRETLKPLARNVAYLNPTDDEEAGYISLLHRSLRTTRRPDVIKVAATFRALGRAGIGALIEACHELAQQAAAIIAAQPRLELDAEPVLSTVVFRYRTDDPADSDRVNAALRRNLLHEGVAVVGRAEHPHGVRLKLTILNPAIRVEDLSQLIARVVAAGLACSQHVDEAVS